MHEWSRELKKDGGFTLIEAVMVIIIGGVIVPSILLGLGMTIKGNSETLAMYRNATIADLLLREKMDEMIGLSYDDSELDPVMDETMSIDEEGFTGIYSISYIDDGLDSSGSDVGYKKITVRISTPDERTYDLNAVVTSWQ